MFSGSVNGILGLSACFRRTSMAKAACRALPALGRESQPGNRWSSGTLMPTGPIHPGWRRDWRGSGVLSHSSAAQPPQKGLTLVPAAGRSATSFPQWFSPGWASARNSLKQLLTFSCFIGRIYPSQGAEVTFHPLQIKPIPVIRLGTGLALWTQGEMCFKF